MVFLKMSSVFPHVNLRQIGPAVAELCIILIDNSAEGRKFGRKAENKICIYI